MAMNEHIESLSALRQLDAKIYVLDYEHRVLDEISGLVDSASISIDADSDIRRTMNISMMLSQGFSRSLGTYNYYNTTKRYYKGDVVKFKDGLYECINTPSTEMVLIDDSGNALVDEDDNVLTTLSGDGSYIVGIPPYYEAFWGKYTAPIFEASKGYWAAGNPYWFDKYIKVEVGIKNVDYYQYDAIADYNNDAEYYIGDMVKYGGRIYQCKTVAPTPMTLMVKGETEGATEEVQTSDALTVQVKSTDAKYVKGIAPTDINYWREVEEYTWINQGVYMINAPSITYNATENSLSFQAVDLMSKLTGMRNGYLDGMTYQIKAGSDIVGAISTVLQEQGFTQMVLNTPPINETPIDINIDIGSTAYNLLTQLRDINPNWEMFFDVNGVFRFQQIPSGADEVSEFGDEVWDKVGLGYNLDTNFEDVKNYIEIVGKQIEPDEVASAEIDDENNRIVLTLSRPLSSYYSTTPTNNVVWYIGFTLGDITQAPTLFAEPYQNIQIFDSTLEASTTITIPPDNPPIYYNNESYFVRLEFSSTSYVKGSFAGYLQPRAIAFENNVESPFYVGSAIEHISALNSMPVDFVKEGYSEYIAEYSLIGVDGVANLDITTGLNYQTFEKADVGDQWPFKVNAITNNTPITTINISYGGGAYEEFMVKSGTTFTNFDVVDSGIYSDFYVTDSVVLHADDQPIYKDGTSTASNNEISLDFDSGYLLTMEKVEDGEGGYTLKVIGQYYPIPSEAWETPTTKIHNVPRFTKMVRGVFSGDEYDNIYTNDLAQQRAQYELYLNCRLHDTISINCVPLYWLDVNKLMTYTINDKSGNDTWIIKSINTDFSVSGTQSVNAMRYYPLYKDSGAGDILDTTWYFNDIVDWGSCPYNLHDSEYNIADVQFLCGADLSNVECSGLYISKDGLSVAYYFDDEPITIYENDEWVTNEVRVIRITGGTLATSARFGEWLTENATQIPSTLMGTRWRFNDAINVSDAVGYIVDYSINSDSDKIAPCRGYLSTSYDYTYNEYVLRGYDAPLVPPAYIYYVNNSGWQITAPVNISIIGGDGADNLCLMGWLFENATRLTPYLNITYVSEHGTTPLPKSIGTKMLSEADLPDLGVDGEWEFQGWYLDPTFDHVVNIGDVLVNNTTLYAYWERQ